MNTINNEAVYDKLWANIGIRNHAQYPEWNILKNYISPDKTVLEIGPGTRPKTPITDSYFMDISSECVNKINQQGGNAVKGSIVDIPFNNLFFDIVCGFDVIEHIQDDLQALSEINRILTPKGKFFFSVPLHQRLYDDFDRECGHARRYEPEDLIKKLTKSGFQVTALSKHGLRPKSKITNKIAAYLLKNYPEFSVKISNSFYRLPLILSKPNTVLIKKDYIKEMNKLYNALIIAEKN